MYIFIKDLATVILTIWGLIIAGRGLATWKKQITGVKEFETAYNLRYSILKLRDSIKHVRNPAIWPSESQKATKYAEAKYPEKIGGDLGSGSHPYVYEMRWEEIVTSSTEMESHLLAAEVLWGPEVLKLIKPLNKKITELNICLKQYFEPDFRTQSLEKLRKVIYDMSGEDAKDEFSLEIEKTIKAIVEYIKDRIS